MTFQSFLDFKPRLVCLNSDVSGFQVSLCKEKKSEISQNRLPNIPINSIKNRQNPRGYAASQIKTFCKEDNYLY